MIPWNLQRLAHFVAVADSPSLSQAARKVHLSQPALTKSIHKLEEEVGVRLFDRSATVELTPLGRQFLPLARQALAGIGDLAREMDLLKGLETGELKVACGPLLADALVGPATARLLALHPGLKIHVMVGAIPPFPAMLRAREIDFFVSDLDTLEGQDDLEIERFPPARIAWFCRPGHPLLACRTVSLAQLFSYPLVGPNLAPWAAEWVRKNQPEKAEPYRPALTCSHYPVLKAVVTGTDAISGATLLALADDLVAGKVVLLNVQAPEMVLHAGTVHLRGRSLSPAARILIEEMHALAKTQANPKARGKAKTRHPVFGPSGPERDGAGR